jgi:hypothetical protein
MGEGLSRDKLREHLPGTYIWKDNAPGREFKEHLARKAAEGHGKMTKKLVFQA